MSKVQKERSIAEESCMCFLVQYNLGRQPENEDAKGDQMLKTDFHSFNISIQFVFTRNLLYTIPSRNSGKQGKPTVMEITLWYFMFPRVGPIKY